MTQTISTIKNDVKRDIMFQIIWGFDHAQLSVGRAQAIAKDFLATASLETMKDIVETLQGLANRYTELRTVFIKYATLYDNERRTTHVQAIIAAIHENEIEKALAIAKGGVLHV